jgi:hypothetical protein
MREGSRRCSDRQRLLRAARFRKYVNHEIAKRVLRTPNAPAGRLRSQTLRMRASGLRSRRRNAAVCVGGVLPSFASLRAIRQSVPASRSSPLIPATPRGPVQSAGDRQGRSKGSSDIFLHALRRRGRYWRRRGRSGSRGPPVTKVPCLAPYQRATEKCLPSRRETVARKVHAAEDVGSLAFPLLSPSSRLVGTKRRGQGAPETHPRSQAV